MDNKHIPEYSGNVSRIFWKHMNMYIPASWPLPRGSSRWPKTPAAQADDEDAQHCQAAHLGGVALADVVDGNPVDPGVLSAPGRKVACHKFSQVSAINIFKKIFFRRSKRQRNPPPPFSNFISFINLC